MTILEDLRDLFISSIVELTAKIKQVDARVDQLATTILLVQDQVKALCTSTPAQGSGA